MPIPSKKPPTNVKPVPGTIVWVRRRNGSWWPGRIISKKELLASNVMSPRSGTPVKLLGREDASVDWYNIEKSKRVKAFRCGEFDECIERAQAMARMQSKRREKYARREDAIVDAIELEREQIEHLRSVSGNGSSGKKSKLKGKQKSLQSDQPMKGTLESSLFNQPSGAFRKYPRKSSHLKARNAKDRDTSDLEDGPALLPRMRGLQDLVSGGASSKISSFEGYLTVEGSSEASLLDDPPILPDQCRSMKRKRSSGRPLEDVPSKRRDRRRPILQVLETLERDNDHPMEVEENRIARCPPIKAEGLGEGEDKHSDECESTQETLNLVSHASNRNTAHFLDAHSASYSSKHLTMALQHSIGEGMLPSHHSLSTGASVSALQQGKVQAKGEGLKGAHKNKASAAQIPPRTLASLGDAGPVQKAMQLARQGKGDHNLSQVEQRSSLSRPHLTDGSMNSVCRNGKGKPVSTKSEAEETVTACCPSLRSDGQKGHSKEGPVHPRARFEKQPVPMVSLLSTVNQKPVVGYPVAVEVLGDLMHGSRKKRATAKNQSSTAPKPTWQTAKRTARQRTPRPGIPACEDVMSPGPNTGKGQRKSLVGKEALSKKLLKRAVLTSKKIRTLASISEEKKGLSQAELGRCEEVDGNVMLRASSSDATPRWPVATLVPVSVALSRLRAVVCS